MEEPNEPPSIYNDDMDSECSTPYVSAPSSPGRAPHYYYSAPASPMHFLLSTTSLSSISSSHQIPFSPQNSCPSFDDFDFSAPNGPAGAPPSGPMSSADELFFNGKIRPMKLPTLIDDEDFAEDADAGNVRGRDMKLRSKSLRRRTRSMSPLRSTASFDWVEDEEEEDEVDVAGNGENEEEGKVEEEDVKLTETRPCDSRRSSKRWVMLKEFLYRSKSEGRNTGHKFWGNLSFSPVLKDRKMEKSEEKTKVQKMKSSSSSSSGSNKDNSNGASEEKKKKRTGAGMGKRRMTMPSAHEMHYKTNRAQAEEMRKKTFLPYRQGLLGCLGFSSRSYGAWNGFTRALNPVSSR